MTQPRAMTGYRTVLHRRHRRHRRRRPPDSPRWARASRSPAGTAGVRTRQQPTSAPPAVPRSTCSSRPVLPGGGATAGVRGAGRSPRLIVLNNVGGFWNTRRVTADGLEHTFALNHLAPFLLTGLLLDRLKENAPSRVVTVLRGAGHGPDRLHRPPGRAGLLGAAGLQPVQAGERALHLRAGQEAAGQRRHRQRAAPRRRPDGFRGRGPGHDATAAPPPRATVHEDAEQGAATSIHLASAPELEHVSGRYFANSWPMVVHPHDEAAAAWWDVSCALTGINGASRRKDTA